MWEIFVARHKIKQAMGRYGLRKKVESKQTDMFPFPHIRFVDVLDIFIVALLVYELYRMLKGTNIIRIFWALLVMYIRRYASSSSLSEQKPR